MATKSLIAIFLTIFYICDVQSAKVVIVGSGLSGYSAAARLMEKNINDIVILEAENRMGGRINSVPFGDNKFIDLGAQWCHGQTGNAIWEMIKSDFAFGSSNFDKKEAVCVMSDGVNPDTANDQAQRMLKLTENIIFNSASSQRSYPGSIGDFFISTYNSRSQSYIYSDIPTEIKNLVLDFAPKYVNAFWSSKSWFDINPKLDVRSNAAGGDQDLTWKTSGFKTVFDYINKKRPVTTPSNFLDVDSKIQLNKEVTNIKYNPNGIGEKVTLTCADGSTYDAEYVIFTGSLGVLKDRHDKIFTPNLPTEKVAAISQVGFGVLNKIFLEFPTIFWPTRADFTGYQFLWKKADLDNLPTDKTWLVSILGFDRVDSYPNLIEIFYAGENTKTFETISDEKMKSDVMWLLNKFLGTVVTSIPQPTNVVRTRWESNRNFLGSYSYSSMKADSSSQKNLKKPLLDGESKPRISFAGEAVQLDYPSYAHGAVLSGRETADSIVPYLSVISFVSME